MACSPGSIAELSCAGIGSTSTMSETASRGMWAYYRLSGKLDARTRALLDVRT